MTLLPNERGKQPGPQRPVVVEGRREDETHVEDVAAFAERQLQHPERRKQHDQQDQHGRRR